MIIIKIIIIITTKSTQAIIILKPFMSVNKAKKEKSEVTKLLLCSN